MVSQKYGTGLLQFRLRKLNCEESDEENVLRAIKIVEILIQTYHLLPWENPFISKENEAKYPIQWSAEKTKIFTIDELEEDFYFKKHVGFKEEMLCSCIDMKSYASRNMTYINSTWFLKVHDAPRIAFGRKCLCKAYYVWCLTITFVIVT